jgi:exonuclease VII small subunit
MVTPRNPYAPEPVSLAEQLRQAYIGLEQVKKQLAGLKRGSAEYKTAKANLDEARKKVTELEAEDKKQRTAAKEKEIANKRAKLVDSLERAKDYGTSDEVTKAKEALDKFDGKNPEFKPSSEVRYGPSGESLVPGTAEYEAGKTKPTVATTSGTTSGATSGTGGTAGGTGGGTSGKGKTPAVDTKTAWIGYLQATFKTLPQEFKNEIDKIFEQALAPGSGWTQDTFNEAIQQTKWYQQTMPSIRNFFLETNDPRNQANFAEKLQIETANVAAKLEQLGIRTQQVDPVTGKVYDNSATIQGIAMSKLQNGWTDVQLTQHLGDNAQLLFTGGGTIGSSVTQIRNAALNYGITLDKNYLNTIQTSLLDATDGRDTQYYLNEMRNQAMDLYKPFSESIKSGRTLYEITNNYRTKMSELLEVDPDNLSWKDMMAKVIDPTTGNARMLSDFTKQVKQDPLWQYTKNAKETYSNMAADLMKQFGFMG